MTHRSYADELEAAAADIGNRSIPDLQILIQRAAVRLRSRDTLLLDEEVEAALAEVMDEMERPRPEVLRIIVTDWLVLHGKLLADELEEDSETEGGA